MGESRTEIGALWEGRPAPADLRAALDEAVSYCPKAGCRLRSGHHAGIRWVDAFTSGEAPARLAVARGAGGAGGERWNHVRLEGARLREPALPAMGGPAGFAVDAGSEQPMLFPALETVEKAEGR